MIKMQTVMENPKEQQKRNRLVIVCSKGSLDMAYPPLFLANTAAAMGMQVDLYFTFWGINMIAKKTIDSLKVSPVGNAALPIPNILGMIPGMSSMMTSMMQKKMQKIKIPSVKEMIATAKESGVKFHACSNTMEIMGFKKEDLIPEVDDVIGAATYLDLAAEDAITLFI
jgi:peroxiredoxin family protein